MQTTENHSDRRRNERRHDSRRINPMRSGARRSDARRSAARLNRSFEASVLYYDGKTVNVSARGAYLEVTTKDTGVFPIGASLPLLINVVTKRPKDRERKYRLSGIGTVVRNCIIQNSNQTNSVGVAFKFTEKLHTELDND
jgi:hypothetical protein